MRHTARFVASRFVFGALTLIAISAVTFFATDVVPSDPARVALGKFATQEQVAAYRADRGLDRPVGKRYLTWVRNVARGEWGESVLSKQPVSSLIGPRIVRSVILSFCAMLLAVPIAFILGVFSAQRIGKPSDLAISFTTLLVNSLPEFVVGIAYLMVFAVWLNVLPIGSSAAALGSGSDVVLAYVLPVLALATVLVPYMARMVRANVRDISGHPFVRSATLRGVPRRRLIWRHVVPNASIPVVNVVALTMAELIAGVVIIETVFGFPGIGQLLINSVGSKDIPTVQIITIIIGFGFVILNFAADLVVLLLNPKLRTG